MTCVVGLEHAGSVYLGGDSALTDSDTGSLSVLRDPKVFVRSGCLVGTASSMRILQLVGHVFVPPPQAPELDDVQHMVVGFVGELKAFLEKNGCLKRDGDCDSHDAQHLVGYRGSLYGIDSDFQAHRVACGWAAIGSGADIALGSMHTTSKLRMSPKDRVMAALRAAEAHNAHVRRPFHVIRLEKEKT